ncbi:hypothetical protein HYT53_05975 [Candidatus Woesearchaeota archaeon]|nr:hypothetical protein [Candidatus Woesearchaeota archaeon]
MTESKIVGIILMTAAFFLIISIWDSLKGNLEAKTTEQICKLSVVAREKSYTEFYDPVSGKLKIGSAASPLACRTTDKYIPEDKDATKEDIQKEMAGLMAKCWNQFGEGLIQDVFKQGDFVTKNCFVCYTLSMRETSKFKGEIKADDLQQYMFDTPYKVPPKADFCKVNGGVCINSENLDDCKAQIQADPSYVLIDKKSDACKKDGKKACCYTEYGCWNQGGKCSGSNPDMNEYAEYNSNGWECPPKLKCYTKKEDYYSYGDYIQRFGGSGNALILADIMPGETYAISFGSPTGQCGWCTTLGLAAGTAVGVVAGIYTGGLGWAVLFGGGAYTITKGGSEKIVVENIGKFFERDLNTVYLTTLNQIQSGNYCSIVKDIRET